MLSTPEGRVSSDLVVHLVTCELNGLSRSVTDGLGHLAAVHIWRSLPRPASISAGTMVVIDLADPPPDARPRELLPLLSRTDAWLLLGKRSVQPAWLEVVQHPRVRVVSSPTALVADLLDRLRGLAGTSIAELVLEHEPGLQRLGGYVRAICSHPWRIRRPRDLAALAGDSLRQLKWRCQAEGFTRVEHFIVCVRAVALAQLRACRGLTTAAARALVGFQDPSNMRRHLGRALQRSPRAAYRLQPLAAE
jgi:AraC-like DNA-binding protein